LAICIKRALEAGKSPADAILAFYKNLPRKTKFQNLTYQQGAALLAQATRESAGELGLDSIGKPLTTFFELNAKDKLKDVVTFDPTLRAIETHASIQGKRFW
jgi:hypothetical protein